MKEIRWHGRGGQGAFTASKLLGAAAVKMGSYALAFPSFGPERRGAPVQAFTKISDTQVTDRSIVRKCDFILFLDETLYTQAALQDLKPGGLLLLNTATPEKYAAAKGTDSRILTLDADRIAEKILGRPVSNTAMLAALAAASGIVSEGAAEEVLQDYLPARIVAKNRQVIAEVYAQISREQQRAGKGVQA